VASTSVLRIGVDYTAAVRQGGGIGRYTRNLMRAVADLDSRNQYVLLVAGGWTKGENQEHWPGNFHLCSLPLSDRWMNLLWQRLRIPVPVRWFTGPLDLFHSPDFVLPPTGRLPAILTVHDLSFLRVPQFFVSGFREYLESAVSRAVNNATHILVDSDSTRRDLAELMGVEARRVTVVYPGVESRFRPILDRNLLDSVRVQYGLPERFILGLSTLQPRKNFQGLIAAFEKLLATQRDPPVFKDLKLVIAGGKGWMYDETLSSVERLGLQDKVLFPGFIKDEDLPALYTLASVFAFPSWYEGFGLPILEAMACGTPVVAADNSSLPEVAGDAALMVDASDTVGLSRSLARVLIDEALRRQLEASGRKQAARFTWQAAAAKLVHAYNTFGHQGSPQQGSGSFRMGQPRGLFG
jgi:glycosyltransferase involved in cell wall biosynthesis